MSTNISKYETVSGNPKLQLVCECGFSFKTSGLTAHCPSCGKVHTAELSDWCRVCNCPHFKDSLRGKNWVGYILEQRAKRRRS